MVRTGWYKGDQTPIRVGPYERQYPAPAGSDFIYLSYWDGKCWNGSRYRESVPSHFQELPWRGLTEAQEN